MKITLEQMEQIQQIISDTDRDMDRLSCSLWDELRVEAYEQIRQVLDYIGYIPPVKKDT